jgi:hypothetical protein
MNVGDSKLCGQSLDDKRVFEEQVVVETRKEVTSMKVDDRIGEPHS